MFPFKQPVDHRDCGFRCIYYIVKPNISYEEWMEQFKFLSPRTNGIYFTSILPILDFYKVKYKFTIPTENGLYLIWSGIYANGHYFIYHNGKIFDSLMPYKQEMKLKELINRIESYRFESVFYCLEIEKCK